MEIAQAKYAELKTLRDQIEVRLREIEALTVEDIERMARDFGFSFNGASTTGEPKQKRKRRTKAEIQAANGATIE